MAALTSILQKHYDNKITAAKELERLAADHAARLEMNRRAAEGTALSVLLNAFDLDELDVEAEESGEDSSYYYITVRFETGHVQTTTSWRVDRFTELPEQAAWWAYHSTDTATEHSQRFEHFLDAALFAVNGPAVYPKFNGFKLL